MGLAMAVGLRRDAVEVFGADLELPAFVLVADADDDDLSAVKTERSAVLDDNASPVDAWDVRGYVVADLERFSGGSLSGRHGLEGITRAGEVLAFGIGLP